MAVILAYLVIEVDINKVCHQIHDKIMQMEIKCLLGSYKNYKNKKVAWLVQHCLEHLLQLQYQCFLSFELVLYLSKLKYFKMHQP